MLKYEHYYDLLGEAKICGSAEDFRGEYGYPANCHFSSEGLIRMCDIIFAVAQENWKGVIALSGTKMAAFARKYGVPYTSLQKWVTDNETLSRTAPAYVLQLIGYAMIAEIPTEAEEADDA